MNRGRALPLAVLAACAVGSWAGDLPEIKKRGTLRVLVAADEPPETFSFSPIGPPGFEREILQGFARTQHLELKVVTVREFDQMIPLLRRGEGDLIVGIVDTEARRELIAFTAETFPVRHVVVTRKPFPAVATLRELRALRVGVIPGTSWASAALEAGVTSSNMLSCVDQNEILAALRGKKIDATVMSILDFSLAQKRDPELQAGLVVGQPTKAAWGVRRQDLALRRALDEYLESLRASPARSQLMLKYFTADAMALLARAREQ